LAGKGVRGLGSDEMPAKSGHYPAASLHCQPWRRVIRTADATVRPERVRRWDGNLGDEHDPMTGSVLRTRLVSLGYRRLTLALAVLGVTYGGCQETTRPVPPPP